MAWLVDVSLWHASAVVVLAVPARPEHINRQLGQLEPHLQVGERRRRYDAAGASAGAPAVVVVVAAAAR